MTVEELAGYLKLAAQTIRRYVLNREIPYQKIRKVIRFRLFEIERWVDAGGLAAVHGAEPDKSGFFTEPGVGETGMAYERWRRKRGLKGKAPFLGKPPLYRPFTNNGLAMLSGNIPRQD